MIASMCHPPPLPRTPTLSHPPVIKATCVRAPGRLNGFVKGPQWMGEARAPVAWPSRADLSPFRRHSAWGGGGGGGMSSLPVLPSLPPRRLPLLLFCAPAPCRDNQAYVKTTCSFDSHQLISDPIKPKSAIVRPSKCLKSACSGERGRALYPANHS